MTLLRLALRSHLGGFVATAAVLVLFAAANALGYTQIAGTDPAQRALFARQMEIVGRELTYILPVPLQLETMSGYLHWRVFGTVPLMVGFWAIVAASGAGRGDEERGLVEAWLAAGVSRAGYLAARVAAFALAAVAAVALTMAMTWVGSAAGDEAIPAEALALQGVNVVAIALITYAFALAIAQLTETRRSAAGIAGVLMLALFLVNSSARTGGLAPVRWLSPFWAYDRSTPLLRGGSIDGPAAGAMLGAAALLLLLAFAAFVTRDLGASLLRSKPRSGAPSSWPASDPLLRLPVIAIVEQQRGWVLGWTIGLAALAAFLVSLTRTMVDGLLAVPSMRAYFERLGPAGYDTFIEIIWISTALLLVSLFAIFQVGTWVADDAEGRLEAALAQPISRARVMAERLGSLFLASAAILAGGSVAVWLEAANVGIALTPERFAAGSALMILVPMAFGAIGAVLAGWRPRAAVPVLTAVAVAGYFDQQFAPLFDWPKWVENASIYALYGSPMVRGIEWGGIAVLGLIVAGGGVVGTALFERRDVGR